MHQENQTALVIGGGIITHSTEHEMLGSSIQCFECDCLARREQAFQAATILNGYEEVTDEKLAIRFLTALIYETETEADNEEIGLEYCQQSCESTRWMIASLIGSPYWEVSVLCNGWLEVIDIKYTALSAEQFAERDKYIDDYFAKFDEEYATKMLDGAHARTELARQLNEQGEL